MCEEVKNQQERTKVSEDDKEVDEIVSEIAEKVDGFFYGQEPKE